MLNNELIKARQDAIDIMESVKANNYKLEMASWQDPNHDVMDTAKEIHECGSSACFGGYVAVSPQWNAITGNGADRVDGSPTHNLGNGEYLRSDESMAKWLGISIEDADYIMFDVFEPTKRLYNLPSNNITVDHVLEVLYRLRDTGSIWHAQ